MCPRAGHSCTPSRRPRACCATTGRRTTRTASARSAMRWACRGRSCIRSRPSAARAIRLRRTTTRGRVLPATRRPSPSRRRSSSTPARAHRVPTVTSGPQAIPRERAPPVMAQAHRGHSGIRVRVRARTAMRPRRTTTVAPARHATRHRDRSGRPPSTIRGRHRLAPTATADRQGILPVSVRRVTTSAAGGRSLIRAPRRARTATPRPRTTTGRVAPAVIVRAAPGVRPRSRIPASPAANTPTEASRAPRAILAATRRTAAWRVTRATTRTTDRRASRASRACERPRRAW